MKKRSKQIEIIKSKIDTWIYTIEEIIKMNRNFPKFSSEEEMLKEIGIELDKKIGKLENLLRNLAGG